MFLTLPREIRDKIYEYSSPPQVPAAAVRAAAIRTEKVGWSPRTWSSSVKTIFFQGRPAELGPVQLLRVCKQIHEEAKIVFYGNKTFVFSIGYVEADVQPDRSEYQGGDVPPMNFTHFDNTAWIPATYLQLVKHCIINVEPARSWSGFYKTGFLEMKLQIQSFADRLQNHHSLKDLQIVYGHEYALWGLRSSIGRIRLSRQPEQEFQYKSNVVPYLAAQNLLEPLGGIYGIPSVIVTGVRSDLAAKLAGAMTCGQKAVAPAQETDNTGRVKVKCHRVKKPAQQSSVSKYNDPKAVAPTQETDNTGRVKVKRHPVKKRAQQYRVSKYNDPKVIWNLDLIGPLHTTAERLGIVTATRKAGDRSQHGILNTAQDTVSSIYTSDSMSPEMWRLVRWIVWGNEEA